MLFSQHPAVAWWLVFHLLGIILWAGGLLHLSRMLGYHTREAMEVQERLSWMEFRMYYFVSLPGLAITLVTGVGMLVAMPMLLQGQGWLHAKLGLVAGLIVLDQVLRTRLMALRAQPALLDPRPFKILHGLIGLGLIGILILAFVRPF